MITIEEQPYFSTPIIYTAVCVCGYSSGKQKSRLTAVKCGQAHVDAELEPAFEDVSTESAVLAEEVWPVQCEAVMLE